MREELVMSVADSPSLPSSFLTNKDLAQLLRVSVRTVSRWNALDHGPPRIQVGRLILYRPEAVHRWLKRRELNSAVSVSGKAAAKPIEGRASVRE
jgi:excisionase family DNA binding protein